MADEERRELVVRIAEDLLARMEGETGSATLHFKDGRPIRLEVRLFTRVDGSEAEPPSS